MVVIFGIISRSNNPKCTKGDQTRTLVLPYVNIIKSSFVTWYVQIPRSVICKCLFPVDANKWHLFLNQVITL